MLKHYVEFYYPGTFVAETETREVASRDVPPDDVPRGAYGYRFFDREEVEQDGETLRGERKNWSPTTFYGHEYTVEQLKAEFPSERILISNVEGNGYKRAVRTDRGWWQQLSDGDVVLPARAS
jgi:hypothetical protein